MEQSLRPSPVTTSSITNTTTGEIYTVSHEVLFADTFINGGDGGGQGDQGSTPSLTEAILETDSFLRNFGITDNSGDNNSNNSNNRLDDLCKMDLDPFTTNSSESKTITTVSSLAIPIMSSGYKTSPNTTPTNTSPVVTPKTSSPTQQPNKFSDPKFIDEYVGQKLFQEKARPTMNSNMCAPRPQNNTFRSFYNGLDPIPEYGITDSPTIFQPLIPPPIPPPKLATTTSYNISFPTTLQPRDRFDIWRGQGGLSQFHNSAQSAKFSSKYSSETTGSSCGSSIAHSPGGSSVTSPFHDALATNPTDMSEFQPLNVIESSETSSRKSSSGYSSRSSSGNKLKPSKRSRTNSPNCDEHDLSDGASSRQRRKSNSGLTTTTETKRRDTIKTGLEDLQRALPQFGTPEKEKISQATILSEAAKYLKSMKQTQIEGLSNLDTVKHNIEELNQQIESLQGKLPDNGAMFSMDKNMISAKCNLPDQFADHVVERTHQNWKYWVFTNIMGHFVHSFAQEVSATSLNDLQTTSLEWVTNSMSLQQLRKDASRKLAKLCAKTSISEDPSKLPDEAIRYVSSAAHRRHTRHNHTRTSMK